MLIRRKSDQLLPRPVIKTEMGPADWILEAFSVIALLSFFGLLLYQYHLLPETIPTHFNAAGEADDVGSKDTIWILPVIAVVIWVITTLLTLIPQTFNFPVKITQQNAKVQYVLAIRLIRIVKLVIILIFFYLGYATAMIARAQQPSVGSWFFPALIGSITIPVVVYFILAHQNKR